jgi:hypothetical protein
VAGTLEIAPRPSRAEFKSIRELPSCVEEGWLETLTDNEDPEIAAKAKLQSNALKGRGKK